ncbi:MAG: SiaC family regulatory phosphoprotein [Flavobacteriales bacterium]
MQKLDIKESIKVPRILIDFERGVVNFIGRSTLEKPEEFYPKIIDVIDLYINTPQPITKILIDIEYYNSKSAEYLFLILKKLDVLSKENRSEVKVFWHYDPDDYGIISDINKIKNDLYCDVYAIEYELV